MRRAERLALGMLIALTLAVILVPALAARDPLRIDDVLARRLVSPLSSDARGSWHILGTDRFGRDLFVRMMLAGRLSLLVGVVGSLVAGVLGTLLGALAGWRGGLVDRAVTSAADVLLALPRLVLLLVGVALWQPGLTTILAVLVLTGWMGIARLVRAEVIAVRHRPFVPAATALGARRRACCCDTCCRTPSGRRSWRRRSAWATRSCWRAGCRFSDSAFSRPRRAGAT